MSLEKLKKYADILPWAITIVVSGAMVMNWLGARTETVVERVDKHIVASELKHDSLDTRMNHLDERDEEFHRLQKAQIIGECLENSRQQLALQDLLVTCEKYGIRK